MREACCPRDRKSPPGADSPGEQEHHMFSTSWPHRGHRSGFGFCSWRRGRGSCGGGGGESRGGFGWGEEGEYLMRGGRGGGPGDVPFDGGPGGAFGVRRPLRFLAHKLGLDDRQIGEL